MPHRDPIFTDSASRDPAPRDLGSRTGADASARYQGKPPDPSGTGVIGHHSASHCGRKCPVSSSGYGTPVPILFTGSDRRVNPGSGLISGTGGEIPSLSFRSSTDKRGLPREVARFGCMMAPSLRRLLHFHRTSCHYILLITRRSGESGRVRTDRLNRFMGSGSFSVILIRLVPASGISADSRFRPG